MILAIDIVINEFLFSTPVFFEMKQFQRTVAKLEKLQCFYYLGNEKAEAFFSSAYRMFRKKETQLYSRFIKNDNI